MPPQIWATFAGRILSPRVVGIEFAWPQPYTDGTGTDSFVDNPSSEFNWCDAALTCIPGSVHTNAYLDNFYYQGSLSTNANKLTIGLLYSGFDDSNAKVGWTVGRVISQQCGQVLLDSANEAALNQYWFPTATTHSAIPYMQMATWNDYEEGSEQESGVDNCYDAVNLLPPTGSTIHWTLGIHNNDIYATTKTIHHFTVWTATPQGSTTLIFGKQLLNSATSYNLSGLGLQSGHTYDVYVELVGQPSTQNEMSAAVQYTP